MDIDTAQDEFRVHNDGGLLTIVKLSHNTEGKVVAVNGPVFPQGVDVNDLRVQLLHLSAALEAPMVNDEIVKNLYPKAKVDINNGAESRTAETIENDGAFVDSSDVPVVRNAEDEERTTRVAQAQQREAEAKGEVFLGGGREPDDAPTDESQAGFQ